jgi:hypothetical protein
MQKLHLMEEKRSPSPPKTKPMDILTLKATSSTRGNIITLTNTVKQPRDLLPNLWSNKMLGGFGQECH